MNTLVIEAAHQNGHVPAGRLSGPSLPSQKSVPGPQVRTKLARRRFTTADKLRILKAADTCTKPGELGALLRKEGLYSSALHKFRKQRQEGKLQEVSPEQKRSERKQREADRQRQNRQVQRLQMQVEQLTALLELQKKVSDLLGLHLQSLNAPNSSD
jgi:transposase-like protein